uniref:HECT domain-containing protein n=1 Tax=Cyprinodon variegatus TaxID=28743 RepID=A0A3Q2CZB6_CYPVA
MVYMTLILAGMGRRSITFPESADHLQISGLLTSHYPKLNNLQGGWLLYKALGITICSGQRKLSLIPPETEGYNGNLLKSVTGGGKNLIYIMPLQEKLDMSPLPLDAKEFKGMPKATCKVCSATMPLQVLAVHVKTCVDLRSSGEEFEISNTYTAVQTLPIVIMFFILRLYLTEFPFSFLYYLISLDDVIKEITNAVSTDGVTFDIAVSRKNLLERGIAQWQRQKKTSPTNPLKVTFIGEAGIDTGALRKEFLTVVIASHFFRTVGEIMAVSLAQAGPAPNFLMPWCYRFLCTGSPDFESMDRNDVESANEATLLNITEDILNCGYTGIILVDKKQEMMRSVVLHANLRLLPILQQLREGLRLYGLSDIMSTYPDICQPLFVPGVEMKVSTLSEFSEKGSNKEQSEVDLMNHFQDFLQELEQGSGSFCYLRVAKAFLQWITGQAHIPVLQEERKKFQITVQFLHECESQYGPHKICYPSVAACINTITFPVQHMRSYEDFKCVLLEAFHMGQEFTKV